MICTNNAVINNTVVNNLSAGIRQNKIEDNNMKNSIVRFVRRAAAVLAFGGLLALSHSAANADLVVERWVGPSGALGVPANTTAMQFKVRNTYNYAVSGVRVYTSLIAIAGSVGSTTSPTSAPFNLAPQEVKWINVVIPTYGSNNVPLLGKTLSGMAWVTNGVPFWVSFQNVLPAASLQVGNPTLLSYNNNGSKTYRVAITNNGNANSTAQAVAISTWLYADGQVGAALNQSFTIPGLQVGQSYNITFTTQPTQGYDIKGTITVGGKSVSISL
jgi:hypothetical protein